MHDWSVADERLCRNGKGFDDYAVTTERNAPDLNSIACGSGGYRRRVGTGEERPVERGIARDGARDCEHQGMSHVAVDTQRLPLWFSPASGRRVRPAPP